MEDPNELPLRRRSSDTVSQDPGGHETQHSGMTSRRLPPPWQHGQRLGDFQLELLLGQGSSGYVFRALDLVTRRRCALKILTPESSQDLRRNKLGFRRMMTIHHSSLMRVDLIHVLDGHVAMSMEEVHGDTLAKTLKRYKTLPPHVAFKRLLALARHYGGALAEMHAHALVHRDIKPQNLMVDSREIGRVIDYGLVGTCDPESDPNGFRHYLAGTPRYWSPEALRNQFYTPSGDVFSLGLVMLEALYAITGRQVWQRSEEDRDEDAQLISEAVDDLSQSIPHVLRDACLEMLQIKPEDRPSAQYISRLGLPTARSFVLHSGHQLFGRERELEEICDWLRTIYEGKIERLHIHGPSGIGKTRLIDEVERHLRALRWGQVFRANCRPREDEPLQAFDQIADEIANRYTSFNDREQLQVDVASAAILHQAFPVLKDVVHASLRLPPIASTVDRIDALEAVARLTVELRKVGPLILIIDDVQWADPDSLSILDRLQAASGEMLAIITVGRTRSTNQRKSPGRVLEIKPLSGDASFQLLADAAKRCSVNINRAAIRELADAAAGNPFRLKELTEEFRPGGALATLQPSSDSSISNLGSIDQLWKRRAKRLGQQARKVLPFIATAGRPVSSAQLGELAELNANEVDVAVTELAHVRLVSDEATGEECIAVVSDRVSAGIISGLRKSEKLRAHRAWAQLLSRSKNQEQMSARIANHLFDAGEPSRALSYAIQAAEDAERLFAKTEAAKWYVRVLDLVEGKERLKYLRNAARCYEQADQPVDAARLYRELADTVDDPNERLACRILATELLLRSGRLESVRDELVELCSKLRLPGPKPASQNPLSFVADSLRLAGLRASAKIARTRSDAHTSTRQQHRLNMCAALVRPLSLFDGVLAARLLKIGAVQAAQGSSIAQQMHFAFGAAVFACGNRGAKRTRGEMVLKQLRSQVTRLQDAKISGDYWAAVATSKALSLRWHEVNDAVRMSVNEYEAVEKRHRFEKAHTRWLEVWASWHLGDWRNIRAIAGDMLQDAQQRNDLTGMLLFTSGLTASSLLADDRLEDLRLWQQRNEELTRQSTGTQFVHFLQWLSKSQHDLYVGKFADAWHGYRTLQRRLRYSPLSRVQVVRVMTQSFGTLTALHLAQSLTSGSLAGPVSKTNWLRVAQHRSNQLRDNDIPFTNVLADLADGNCLRLQGQQEQARACLLSSHQRAKNLRLVPYQLAAEDALEYLETGEWIGLLRHRMRNRDVKVPEAFERLYTVAAS